MADTKVNITLNMLGSEGSGLRYVEKKDIPYLLPNRHRVSIHELEKYGRSMEKITLTKNLKLQNGNEVQELSLDFDALSVADFRQIKKLEAQISDNATVDMKDITKPKSLSFEFQLASAFLAAVKGTTGLQISDFSQLSMSDSLMLAQVSSFFWLNVD